MERCPTCNAVNRGKAECRRCHTDFRQIVAVEAVAARCCHLSNSALTQGRVGEALTRARHACLLHRTKESHATLALAALLEKDFPRALGAWKALKANPHR